MNNSNLPRQNRSVRRAEEKAKRRIIVHLIGKGKADKRTYRNLKALFSYIGNREQFTAPQIQKNKGVKSAVLYDLIDALKERGMIEQVGKIEQTPGRGETIIYGLTLKGKIVASYINNDSKLLTTTLKEMAEKEANPLKQYFLNAFMKNYPTDLMRDVLEISISQVKELEEGFNIDDLLSKVFEGAFFWILFLEKKDEKLEEVFRKNAELMEKSPYRDWIFTYFKMQLESTFLYMLSGKKLRRYAESLKENLQFLHIPCENLECTNVIIIDSLLKMNIPQYCGKCKPKESG